jgi:hypothetical protein
MDNTELHKVVDEYYNEFITNENIIGFEGLLKTKGFGSKLRVRIRNLIYNKYGKENLIAIYRSRLAKSAHKNRTKESYYISPEQREKMIYGSKKSWIGDDARKEKSRELMVKYCHPNAWTDETNKKRSKSREGYKHSENTIQKIKTALSGKPLTKKHREALCVPKIRSGSLGLKRSDITKQKLSQITTLQWKSGIHKVTYKSKGQIEVANMFRNEGFCVEEEFFINGKPYDVFVKDKNLIVEFNGTYWHRDPRFYDVSSICQEKWNYDKNKLDIAKQNGYNVFVIWQYDWEHSNDKLSIIKEILNGINQ